MAHLAAQENIAITPERSILKENALKLCSCSAEVIIFILLGQLLRVVAENVVTDTHTQRPSTVTVVVCRHCRVEQKNQSRIVNC